MANSAHDTHAGHDTHDHGHHGPPQGFLQRWVLTTNHKDIGSLYMIFGGVMFLLGGLMAMLIRAELFKPGLQFLDPQFFNSLTTMHALVMIFGGVMPAWVGLANWMIPLQVGAP
ncbi:MAG: cbb3-type cytochrome c oxidase subunit I, partial [Steroidobacteraceae bacterium]